MRITLGNWLYNAGIIGFLRILKEADPSIDVTGLISKGHLEISKELLEKFDIGYAKCVLKKANLLRQKVEREGKKIAPLVDIYRIPDAELVKMNDYRVQMSDITTKDELKASLKGFIGNSYEELKYFIENSADEQVKKAWSKHSTEWDE